MTAATSTASTASIASAAPVVVVADDEIHVVDIIALLLEALGVRVVKAYNGEQALAAVREHRPRLVLTNVRMPKLGGIEVCRQLKALTLDPPIAVVLVTSLPWEDLPPCGADDIIAKPFDASRVEDCARRYLSPPATNSE